MKKNQENCRFQYVQKEQQQKIQDKENRDHLLKAWHLKAYQRMVKSYELSFNFFDAKVVDEILENEVTGQVNKYREFQYLDDDAEYLRRFYDKYEQLDRMRTLQKFYKKSFPQAYALVLDRKVLLRHQKQEQLFYENIVQNQEDESAVTPDSIKNSRHFVGDQDSFSDEQSQEQNRGDFMILRDFQQEQKGFFKKDQKEKKNFQGESSFSVESSQDQGEGVTKKNDNFKKNIYRPILLGEEAYQELEVSNKILDQKPIFTIEDQIGSNSQSELHHTLPYEGSFLKDLQRHEEIDNQSYESEVHDIFEPIWTGRKGVEVKEKYCVDQEKIFAFFDPEKYFLGKEDYFLENAYTQNRNKCYPNSSHSNQKEKTNFSGYKNNILVNKVQAREKNQNLEKNFALQNEINWEPKNSFENKKRQTSNPNFLYKSNQTSTATDSYIQTQMNQKKNLEKPKTNNFNNQKGTKFSQTGNAFNEITKNHKKNLKTEGFETQQNKNTFSKINKYQQRSEQIMLNLHNQLQQENNFGGKTSNPSQENLFSQQNNYVSNTLSKENLFSSSITNYNPNNNKFGTQTHINVNTLLGNDEETMHNYLLNSNLNKGTLNKKKNWKSIDYNELNQLQKIQQQQQQQKLFQSNTSNRSRDTLGKKKSSENLLIQNYQNNFRVNQGLTKSVNQPNSKISKQNSLKIKPSQTVNPENQIISAEYSLHNSPHNISKINKRQALIKNNKTTQNIISHTNTNSGNILKSLIVTQPLTQNLKNSCVNSLINTSHKNSLSNKIFSRNSFDQIQMKSLNTTGRKEHLSKQVSPTHFNPNLQNNLNNNQMNSYPARKQQNQQLQYENQLPNFEQSYRNQENLYYNGNNYYNQTKNYQDTIPKMQTLNSFEQNTKTAENIITSNSTQPLKSNFAQIQPLINKNKQNNKNNQAQIIAEFIKNNKQFNNFFQETQDNEQNTLHLKTNTNLGSVSPTESNGKKHFDKINKNLANQPSFKTLKNFHQMINHSNLKQSLNSQTIKQLLKKNIK